MWDLVRVEVSAERGDKLHPLVTATLAVDEDQHRLLVTPNHVRLQSRISQ